MKGGFLSMDNPSLLPQKQNPEVDRSGKKIAIIGSRGIPANYGGFETFTEELGVRLASKGYRVFVSCEGCDKQQDVYRGVKLFYFPLKPFFRMVYETLYDIHSLVWSSRNCDCVYMLGYGSGFFFFIPKIFGKKLLVNVDGREWKREKYNTLEKSLLHIGEKCAVAYTDIIVADSRAIKKYFDSTYGKPSTFIPYGATVSPVEAWNMSLLNELISEKKLMGAIKPSEYCLAIARIEPDNNIHLIIEGFLRTNTDKKLVIIGNFSSNQYRRTVHNILRKYDGSERVVFVGAVNRKDVLDMLRRNCYVYFHGHMAGGTNPSLLEAMAVNCIVLAHDNEFNREVGADTLLYFRDVEDMEWKLKEVLKDLQPYHPLKYQACERIKKYYPWDTITREYARLFDNIQ